jgi:hypothetical protein
MIACYYLTIKSLSITPIRKDSIFNTLKQKFMKRILLAAGLGLGVLTFAMAGSTDHSTAPIMLKNDTVPTDTTQPTPQPDTTSILPK